MLRAESVDTYCPHHPGVVVERINEHGKHVFGCYKCKEEAAGEKIEDNDTFTLTLTLKWELDDRFDIKTIETLRIFGKDIAYVGQCNMPLTPPIWAIFKPLDAMSGGFTTIQEAKEWIRVIFIRVRLRVSLIVRKRLTQQLKKWRTIMQTKKETEIKIDPARTVIIKVEGGIVSDYYLPDGLDLIVVDYDAIEAGEKVNDTARAAISFLKQRK